MDIMGGFVKVEIDFKFNEEWVESGTRSLPAAGFFIVHVDQEGTLTLMKYHL